MSENNLSVMYHSGNTYIFGGWLAVDADPRSAKSRKLAKFEVEMTNSGSRIRTQA